MHTCTYTCHYSHVIVSFVWIFFCSKKNKYRISLQNYCITQNTGGNLDWAGRWLIIHRSCQSWSCVDFVIRVFFFSFVSVKFSLTEFFWPHFHIEWRQRGLQHSTMVVGGCNCFQNRQNFSMDIYFDDILLRLKNFFFSSIKFIWEIIQIDRFSFIYKQTLNVKSRLNRG